MVWLRLIESHDTVINGKVTTRSVTKRDGPVRRVTPRRPKPVKDCRLKPYHIDYTTYQWDISKLGNVELVILADMDQFDPLACSVPLPNTVLFIGAYGTKCPSISEVDLRNLTSAAKVLIVV